MPAAIDQFQLILIFVAVMVGVVSSTYLYTSTGIFLNLLKRPLRFIASGLIIMAVNTLLAAFIMYEAGQGVSFTFYGLPLQAFFFAFYILGSILIFFGARRLISRPTNVVDVSMRKIG